MAIKISRGKPDEVLKQIKAVLADYAAEHTRAEIELYRRNAVSVRIRIIDPDFARLDRADRCQLVWSYLERLPEEVQSDISSVLLLAPSETKKSFANLEFDNPVPSRL